MCHDGYDAVNVENLDRLHPGALVGCAAISLAWQILTAPQRVSPRFTHPRSTRGHTRRLYRQVPWSEGVGQCPYLHISIHHRAPARRFFPALPLAARMCCGLRVRRALYWLWSVPGGDLGVPERCFVRIRACRGAPLPAWVGARMDLSPSSLPSRVFFLEFIWIQRYRFTFG